MAVNSANLIMGSARLYIAAFGATEPADSAVTPNGPFNPPGGSWVDVGGTDGGVNLQVDGTLTGLTVDQILMEVGARLTDVKMSIVTKLSEITLANIQNAINSIGTLATNTGYSTLDIGPDVNAAQPQYAALCMDGWAPELASSGSALRRVIIRKALAQPKLGLMSDKKTQQALDVTWNAYWVSPTIKPFHLVDQTQ